MLQDDIRAGSMRRGKLKKKVDNQSSLVGDVHQLMVDDGLDIGAVLVDDETSYLIVGLQEKYLSW